METKTRLIKLNNYCKTMRPTAIANGYLRLDVIDRLNSFMYMNIAISIVIVVVVVGVKICVITILRSTVTI